MIPKRTLWVTIGYGAGIASTVYARRKVRRAIGPTGVDAVQRARSAARGVKVAVSEGRAAMRQTEQDLRDEYLPRQPREGRPIR